jgi:hypothetical protein
MTSWKRLLFYLALNVIVAAVTTLLVLTWWDRTHRINLPAAISPAVTQKAATQTSGSGKPAATPLPANQPVIEIKNVFGLGDMPNEVIMLKRVGDGELSMSKWKLMDENGHNYIFPDLVLNKDGAVQVYSRAGVDTVIELYWGLNEAVWKSGEQVTLVDPQGVVRATYTIP